MNQSSRFSNAKIATLCILLTSFGLGCTDNKSDPLPVVSVIKVPRSIGGADVNPLHDTNRTTIISYDMWVPTSAEICQDPPKVHWRDGVERNPLPRETVEEATRLKDKRAVYSALVLEENIPKRGCYEVWAEKWITCDCENRCDELEFWECDCPYTELGQLPPTEGFPFAIAILTAPGTKCTN